MSSNIYWDTLKIKKRDYLSTDLKLKLKKIFRCAECINNKPVGTTLRKRVRDMY